MPLLETDALTIRSTFDSLPDEAKPLASDWLRRYKDQQDEFGLPLFPSEVETQQADESAFVSMFDDVKQVDPGNGIYDQAERLKSGEGDRLRQREAGMRFLAKHYGDEEKVRRDFPLYRDDYAMQNGGKRDMGDGEFYSFVSQQVKRQQGQKLVRSRSLDAGFRAAIEGMGSLEKLAAVKSEAAANTDNEVDAGAFLEAYGETQKVMSKHAAFIRETVQAVSAEMDGGDVDLEPLKERLLDMPGTERRIVLAALRMEADKAGEKIKGEKGGKFDLFAGKLLQQTGEAAARIASNAMTGNREYESFVNLVPETGSVRFSGNAIKTPEDARKFVHESIAQDMASRASSSGAGPGGVGAFPPMDSRNEITLDEGAQRLIQDAKEREMKRLRVANEIRSIGEAADPIPNVFASTIGTSGAALALIAGTRGLAAPALASAYTNIEFNDLSLKYPQMSTADKTQIAAISGAAQAALDYVGVKALVKLPGIKSLIAQPLTKQLAGRALARGAMSFGLENLVEAGQDIATPALMQALKSDVPGFDWEAEQREFWKGRADVAIGLLPLILLGIGAASVNEYRGAKNLLSWNDQLGAAGVVETDRVAVIEAAQSGDMGKAQSLLMEAWGRRNPEVAAEYQDAMSQRQTDMSRATAELERLGAIPTLRRDGDGWTVTSNGTSTKFATWEEARDVATAAMGDMERAQTELVASLSDSFMASTPGFLKGESVEFNTDAKGESLVDRVNAGAMTPEQAMEAAVAGGVIKGVTMQEARAIAAEVFGGQNASERAMQFRQDVEKIAVLGRNTVQNGQSRSIVNAAGNERSFLTVVEEVVEGRWKGGLERRAFTKEQGVRWVQLAEAATGETFLEGSTWEEIAASPELAPRALTEAISRIVVADVLGRMKDGKRIGPGTVSSGLNLNDREQSALAAILDAFRKLFRALLETASKLAKARQEGKLGGEYDALFDALTGGSSQLEHDAGAAKEADAIASEAVDTSGYSPETPGPNGETFSVQQLAADFEQKGKFYRVIHGEAAFQDVVESGFVRTNASAKVDLGSSLMERLKARPTAFPSFSKDYAAMSYAQSNPEHFIIVTDDSSLQPSKSGRHSKGKTYFPTNQRGEHLSSLSADKVDIFRHVGNGIYQLVYSRGKNISHKTPEPNGETFSTAVQYNGGVPFKAGDRVRSSGFEATVYSVEPRSGLGYWVVYTDVVGEPQWKENGSRPLAPFAKPFDRYSEPVTLLKRGNSSPIRNEALEVLKESRAVGAKADIRQVSVRETPQDSISYKAKRSIGKGAKASSLKVGDTIQLGSAQTVSSIERRDMGFLWIEFENGNAGMMDGDTIVHRVPRAVPADASKVVQMPDGAQLVGPTTFSIRAYHGTPHKVDKLTTAKIGTGEGAQAYGWGLYFAESEGVARNYQEKLRPRQPDDYDSAFTEAAKSFIASNGNVTLEDLRSAYPNASTAALEWGMREARGQERGNLYTVELLPDESEFLDWDKPLSEQSAKVKAAIRELAGIYGGMIEEAASALEINASTGSTVYALLVNELSAANRASRDLAALGIPGIKYLDAGSRGTGDGTRNFVIFDENLVRILEENGKPVEGETFSLGKVTPAQDAEYLAAVQAGDMDNAQRMVDEAAKAAGYSKSLFTGQARGLTEIPKVQRNELPRAHAFLTDDREVAAHYSGAKTRAGDSHDYGAGRKGRTYRTRVKLANPLDLDAAIDEDWWIENLAESQGWERTLENMLYMASDEEIASLAKEYNVSTEEEGEDRKVRHVRNDIAYAMAENPKSKLVKKAKKRAAFQELGFEWDEESKKYRNGEDYYVDASAGLREALEGAWEAIKFQGYYLQDALSNSPTGQMLVLADNAVADKFLEEGRYDGYMHTDTEVGGTTFIVFDPSQIKSADPVTRDESGKIVPLSQRFNPADNRITYSIRPGDFSARMEAKFSLFQAKPELRLAIAQVAKERALRLGAEWIAKGDVIRSAKDIGKEARMREALAYEARMNEYLDGLSENARQTLEFEPSALEDDPLVAAMLDFGKLMSFTTAKKSGKVEAKSGDYDGQPWLPPAWFSKGAGIMPDQMAQAMFDAGLLPDAYTGTLWSELEKRIEATRKDKAAHREAVQAYKAAEKYARDASRAEADQWAENTKKQAGSPKAQRDMLKAALRTLDGILAAAPPEVRARVGGYVKLAGLATDEAMLQEIERRIDKLNVELEKYLKKQAVAEITKLFKKARPDMEAGKKGKGKDADMHALFAAAEAAADMDALAVAGRLADLDARIASGELTAEQEALAMTERGIVELVGDLKNADSGRAFSALDTLRDIYGGAWLKWKIAEIERKERRAGLRQDFIEATGKAGVRTERTKADKVNESLFGKGKAWLLNLSSMREVLAYAFGLDNERVTSLVDAERTASNTYEDANQRLGDEIEGLFTAMAGTRTKGERLRWNLSQRTIKTGKGELSQLEAIQALLMWRQEDGRRHMEGTRDESGKVTSSWSYDQAWIDEIEAALTPEARQVMSFIMGKYAAEWATLNPLYRARYGVNMPHHDAYAPITVTPVQTKAGEVVDPVTGSAVSGGSILTPGSLRTRSRNAIAEPDFRDALQTMILHSRQMEYWKAYYDLAVEMNAVLGNREVMNSVHAKGGKEAANALRQWIDVIGQGGFRDASLRLALFQAGSKLQGRAAGVALLGRMSAILSQSTQLAAAAVKMPVTSYLVRLAKLMTGGLGWRDAMRSDFIQRRFKTAPPIVRQAMDSLASAKPNEIQGLSRFFGNVLSGADAFFTSGTYAILLDYHREQGRAAGLSGAELDAYAHTEAERATEQVAQPTRTANRSLAELSNTGPLGKIGWAFASEARQKVALAAHAALNAKNDPVTAAKSAFLTFAIGGLFTQVLKNLLREAKGDDDGEMWSLGRLGYAMTIAPLASAIPFGSAIAGDSNMLSNIQRAIQTLGNEEVDFRDVDAMLSAAGLFNDTAASLAQLSHLGLDLGKILANAAD